MALPDNFCIIESPESVKDFASLQLDELEKNIATRRNKIFLLMEEVRGQKEGGLVWAGVPLCSPCRRRLDRPPERASPLTHCTRHAPHHARPQVRRLRIQMRLRGASEERVEQAMLEQEASGVEWSGAQCRAACMGAGALGVLAAQLLGLCAGAPPGLLHPCCRHSMAPAGLWPHPCYPSPSPSPPNHAGVPLCGALLPAHHPKDHPPVHPLLRPLRGGCASCRLLARAARSRAPGRLSCRRLLLHQALASCPGRSRADAHLTRAALRRPPDLSTAAGIITFGGLVSPILEVKLGLGGSSYRDLIANMHLPVQLAQVRLGWAAATGDGATCGPGRACGACIEPSPVCCGSALASASPCVWSACKQSERGAPPLGAQVDPIVASFCGGGVGVLTALLIVEANNAKMQVGAAGCW